MNRAKLVLFIAAMACLPTPARSQAAPQAVPPRAYVKIVGKVQGTFKGEASRIAGNNYIAALRFGYEITSPRDPATGLATGKRQHMPITFTKALDATSPQIFQAMVNNEMLTQVTIEFMTTSTPAVGVGAAAGASKELAYYTITLSNASVSDVHQHMDQAEASVAGGSIVPLEPMEDVSLPFEQITVTSNVGQTTATDSWNTVNK